MDHAIAFIHLGQVIPPHTLVAIAQARLFNRCPIYLVAHQAALEAFDTGDLAVSKVPCELLEVSDKHQQFRSSTKLDKTFRDGFWTFTTERFFYLESLMQRHGLNHVFHLENDYMLYVDLPSLMPVITAHYLHLAGTFDSDQRCIPGFLYARRPAALGALTAFISRAHASVAVAVNDMTLLAAFAMHAGAEYFGALPVVTDDYPKPLRSPVGSTTESPQRYWNHIHEFGGVFDAAALGQFVGGVDPRNVEGRDTTGFINESALYDPSVYSFSWGADAMNRPRLTLRAPQGRPWPIYGLHIHSKRLKNFASGPSRTSPPC